MADTTVTNETAATTPTGAELVRIVQGGSSKKTTAAVLGHQFRGAKVRMTSDDTAQNVTSVAAISFDAAVFDTDTFWSAGSPTRLTIPAGLGITYVALAGQVNVSSSTGDTYFTVEILQRDVANTVKEQWVQGIVEMGGVNKRLSVSTGPVAVEDGDYFQLRVLEESDTSVTIEGDQTLMTTLALHVIGMEPV